MRVVPLPINTFAGDDRVLIEIPAGVNGPAAGIIWMRALGANRLAVRGGGVRIDSIATGGDLTTTLLDGARLATSRLMQMALILEDTSQATLLSDGATSRLTSLSLAPVRHWTSPTMRSCWITPAIPRSVGSAKRLSPAAAARGWTKGGTV